MNIMTASRIKGCLLLYSFEGFLDKVQDRAKIREAGTPCRRQNLQIVTASVERALPARERPAAYAPLFSTNLSYRRTPQKFPVFFRSRTFIFCSVDNSGSRIQIHNFERSILRNDMKTIRDIAKNMDQPSAAPTHVYDRQTKKIYTQEMHGHLRSVRKAFADGQDGGPEDQEDLTAQVCQLACTIAGGCQVPLPAGSIDGGVSFGQCKRITK
jgi:hypothetical protein